MSTSTTTKMLEQLRGGAGATKQAAAATPAPVSVEEARRELTAAMETNPPARPKEAAAGRAVNVDTAVLRQIAGDLQAAETLALVKESQVIGAALIEGMSRAAYVAPTPASSKLASHNGQISSKAQAHAQRLKLAFEQGVQEARGLLSEYHNAEEALMNQQQKTAAAQAHLDAAANTQLQYAARILNEAEKIASSDNDVVGQGARLLDLAFECGQHSLKSLSIGLATAHSNQ